MMESLFALQQIQFSARARTGEAEMLALRADVPAPILAHYDRLAVRGKKGVALVRNGVCGECHLRIPVGKLVNLSSATEVQLCDNCGRYLHQPDETSGTPKEVVPPIRTSPAKHRTVSHVG